MSQHLVRLAALALVVLVLLVGVPGSEANFNRTTYLRGYKVKSTTDPSYECGGCARTRLVGCYNGVCTYRCYRSCTNGYDVIIGKDFFDRSMTCQY